MTPGFLRQRLHRNRAGIPGQIPSRNRGQIPARIPGRFRARFPPAFLAETRPRFAARIRGMTEAAAPTAAGSLRDRMPNVAAFIDAAIREGLAGREGFYACEAGHQVGTPLAEPAAVFTYIEPDRWERRPA